MRFIPEFCLVKILCSVCIWGIKDEDAIGYVTEMLHPPKIPQRQWNGNGTGLERVPVANPLNADVVPIAHLFFLPLLAVVKNVTGSLICLI